MTSVNFNYGINTDEEYAALVEYERRALAAIEPSTSDYITRYPPGVREQQPPPRQPDARRVGGEV